LSHPCGACFDVPHGVANAINLPASIEYNAAGGEDIAGRYRDVAELLGLERTADIGPALAAHVSELARSLGLPTRLSQVGVPESGIPLLVAGAMGDACTLVNPRAPTAEELAACYRRVL
jgi:alcohol dehydrogenase class IV